MQTFESYKRYLFNAYKLFLLDSQLLTLELCDWISTTRYSLTIKIEKGQQIAVKWELHLWS